MGKHIRHKSPNGYSLYMSLICFFLMLQCVVFVCLYTMESTNLILCNKQSIMDLSCISQARGMIEYNTWIRNCSKDQSQLILEKQMEIQGKNVYFKDCETYILCQYEQIQMRIYYDNHFVSGLEITKNVD